MGVFPCLLFFVQSYEGKGTSLAFFENDKSMKQPLFPDYCDNNRGKIPLLESC